MIKKSITYFQFFDMFPDDDSARIYFEKSLWGNDPKCPHCDRREATSLKKIGIYRCRTCKLDFTVRHGTVMYRSKIPLRKWLLVMYLMSISRKGVSSIYISKCLGITQKSAWFLLHRIREACKEEEDDKLDGLVEVDETYIGGKERNKHRNRRLKMGRGAVGKVPVFGLRERYKGRVRAFPINNTSGKTLKDAIREHVEKGSRICSDDYKGYRNLKGYNHLTVNHSKGQYVNGFASTNSIESVWAVIKRSYMGIYHHISPKHLHRYLHEFTFRLNDGNVKIPVMDRIFSLVLGMRGKRVTYEELIGRGK